VIGLIVVWWFVGPTREGWFGVVGGLAWGLYPAPDQTTSSQPESIILVKFNHQPKQTTLASAIKRTPTTSINVDRPPNSTSTPPHQPDPPRSRPQPPPRPRTMDDSSLFDDYEQDLAQLTTTIHANLTTQLPTLRGGVLPLSVDSLLMGRGGLC